MDKKSCHLGPAGEPAADGLLCLLFTLLVFLGVLCFAWLFKVTILSLPSQGEMQGGTGVSWAISAPHLVASHLSRQVQTGWLWAQLSPQSVSLCQECF